LLDVEVVDGVVGPQVLHGLTVLVHVEIWVLAEVVVLGAIAAHSSEFYINYKKLSHWKDK
jgi:hypothetical protein